MSRTDLATASPTNWARQAMRRAASEWPLGLMLLIYFLLFSAGVMGSGNGALADEEAEVPIVAEWLAEGMPLVLLPQSQYMSFCGGCTAEALMAWPLFEVFGPTLLAWKSIPLFFGLMLLALTVLLGRVAAPAVGLLAGCFLLLSPPFFFANALIGYANHFEASVFVLAGVLLAFRYREQPSNARAAVLGLALGIGLWFCYSGAFGIPVALLISLRIKPPTVARSLMRGFSGVVGFALGFSPWLITRFSDFFGKRFGDQVGFSVYEVSTHNRLTEILTSFPIRWPYLAGSAWWESIWHPTVNGAAVGGALPWFLGEIACVLGLLVLAISAPLKRQDGQRMLTFEAGLASLILSFVSVFLLLAPVPTYPMEIPLRSNELRYLMPLVPLLCLTFALCVHRCWEAGEHGRLVAVGLVVVLAGPGIMARTNQIYSQSYTTRAAHLFAADPWTAAGRSPWGSTATQTPDPQGDNRPTLPHPQRPLALRSFNYAQGDRVPIPTNEPTEGRAERQEFAERLRSQPRLQRRTTLLALGLAVLPEQGLTAALPEQAWWLLDDLGPSLATEALEVASTIDRIPWQEVEAVREKGVTLDDLDSDALPFIQRDALAWAIGFGLGTEFARSSELDLERLASGPWHRAFDGQRGAPAWRGFGESVGRRWGYSVETRRRFLTTVDSRWRDQAALGFKDGSEWMFLPNAR
jgi:hypothetical protein